MNLLTEAGYREALCLIDELMDAEPNTPEGERLMTLEWMVEDYEKGHHPIPPPSIWDRIVYWWENKRHWWRK